MKPLAWIALALLALACEAGAPPQVGRISADTLLSAPPDRTSILDVRSEQEYASGHVPDALHVPHDELAERLPELGLSKENPVVVYCERGPRAGRAADILLAAGYRDVRHLEGHMSAWRDSGRPIERPAATPAEQP